jgi:hypothetical protein
MNLCVKISWLGSEEKLYTMTLSVTRLYSLDVGCMTHEYEALE